jgi:hypothetical protein
MLPLIPSLALGAGRGPNCKACCCFHPLDAAAELARAWIPAFAGMTMQAKVGGMGGSSENRPVLIGWHGQKLHRLTKVLPVPSIPFSLSCCASH